MGTDKTFKNRGTFSERPKPPDIHDLVEDVKNSESDDVVFVVGSHLAEGRLICKTPK